MSDFQAYILSVTIISIGGFVTIAHVAIYAIGKYRSKDQ